MRYPKIDFKKIDQFKEITNDDEAFSLIREELSLIMSKLEKETEPVIETQLKNYIIIRLVTLLEVFFQNQVVNLIDNYKIKHSDLFVNDEISISISSLDKLQNASKGKIIATSLSFHSSSDIDFAFSKLLNVEFLTQIKKFNVNEEIPNPFAQNWDKFFEIYHERHKTVHSIYLCKKYSKKQIRQIIDAAEWLTVLSNIVIMGKILETMELSFKNIQPKLYRWLTANFFRKPKKKSN
ncbi:MAG: hypothetical protein OEL81_00530 [Nitrosopumilus sp.]|nr:hypothetical protein [Nitrosopumilus sp.]